MKNAIIYCAGNNFLQYYDRIIKYYNIIALTDSDPQKWGEVLMGEYNVVNPECVDTCMAEVVFIASDRQEIIGQIERKVNKLWPNLSVESILSALISRVSWKSVIDPITWSDKLRNTVCIEGGNYINSIEICFFGFGNQIIIRSGVLVKDRLSVIAYGDGNVLDIGEKTSILNMVANIGEGGAIIIGKNCMFSSGIELFQFECHPIFDLGTKERINHSENITIGDHVWIGRNVALMGGFSVGEDSIIGFGSISSSKFDKKVCIAGSPAKVIRENVTWGREALGLYTITKMDDLRLL